jgi:hypothetical protein
MKAITKTASRCVLALTLGAGCTPGAQTNLPDPPVGTRSVQFFNCTHVGDAYTPPTGQAFAIFARVDGGAWTAEGGANPQPGDWSDCHDAAHTAATVTVNLTGTSTWEFTAIPVDVNGACDSSDPLAANVCKPAQGATYTAAAEGVAVEFDLRVAGS